MDDELTHRVEDLCYWMYESSGNSKYVLAGRPTLHPDEAVKQVLLLIKQDREKNPLQGKFEKIMWVLAGNRSGESVTITISNTYGGLGSSYIGQEIVHQGRTLEKHLDRLIERLTPTNSGADHE